MMTIKEIYENFDQIGCVTFSTLAENGYVESRIAHFFAFDKDGLYFRTMDVKPFYRELKQTGKVSVCGMYPSSRVSHDENNLPSFVPGYTMRITGDMRELTMDEVEEKAKGSRDFNVAVYDIQKYPRTRIFVLYRAWGERYDFDYAKEKRDHKLERKRFTYGGMPCINPGLTITDACTSCGKCAEICSFNAVEKGDPYKINGNRCDECGNCYHNCPVNAIISKG